MTSAVNVSSAATEGVPLSLQAEILDTEIPEMEQAGGAAEQGPGAVPALALESVQAGSAEKAAVKLIALPSALMVTPVKV